MDVNLKVMLDLGDKLKHILNFDVRRTTRDAITYGPNPDKIEDMNKAQLNDGQNAFGGPMPLYTQFTLRNKPAQFIPSNKRYSLKDSGKLQSLIQVTANLVSMTITSTDKNKNRKLQQDSSEGVRGQYVREAQAFGLTEPNREIMCEKIIIPFMQLKLRGKR